LASLSQGPSTPERVAHRDTPQHGSETLTIRPTRIRDETVLQVQSASYIHCERRRKSRRHASEIRRNTPNVVRHRVFLLWRKKSLGRLRQEHRKVTHEFQLLERGCSARAGRLTCRSTCHAAVCWPGGRAASFRSKEGRRHAGRHAQRRGCAARFAAATAPRSAWHMKAVCR
jgi:hypothetical protein